MDHVRAGEPARHVDFRRRFFPPRLDSEFLALIAAEMWRTVAIATCGMALALVLAVPLTLAVLLRRCGAQDGRFSRSSRRSARSARPARPSPSIGKELLSPASDPAFIWRVTLASLETLAMSAVGTLLAAIAGLALARPASRTRQVHESLGVSSGVCWRLGICDLLAVEDIRDSPEPRR